MKNIKFIFFKLNKSSKKLFFLFLSELGEKYLKSVKFFCNSLMNQMKECELIKPGSILNVLEKSIDFVKKKIRTYLKKDTNTNI